MIKFIDQQYAEGCSVTNSKIRNWLHEVHGMVISHDCTVQKGLSRLGTLLSKVKPQKRNLGSFRIKAFRDCLIELDKYAKEIEAGNPNGCCVCICG